jgi:S-adenosylmethionine synthetase
MNLQIIEKEPDLPPFEFVERKGVGHPDTLSDALAEHLSSNYSRYTESRFGAVLHHNFDKVGLLGGSSSVRFGRGRITRPIRVLLNGRASGCFGKTRIPVKPLLKKWATDFLSHALNLRHPGRELEFHFNLSTQSSPGKTDEGDNVKHSARNYWFSPRDSGDIPELKGLFSNDTSIGVGFSPFSTLESFVLGVERRLNGARFRAANPWIGSDIKIMGSRFGDKYMVTMCIPQIADHTPSLGQYKINLAKARRVVEAVARAAGIRSLDLHLNTRDDYEKGEVYLTATGSSIESGDEGLVGRGNRVQGFIAPSRPMSMEGVAGKNPVYHIGKLYYVAAQSISEEISRKFGVRNEVYLVSQSGRDLLDPWIALVRVPPKSVDRGLLRETVEREIKRIPLLTRAIVDQRISIS